MVEAVSNKNGDMEFEVKGGPWERIHVVIFYLAAVMAILATFGVVRLAMGIACILLVFYCIFSIATSPTYVIIGPMSREVVVERYYYLIPRRRRLKRGEFERLSVVESSRPPSSGGDKSSRRDLSYYVHVDLESKGEGKLRLFRSGMAGAPLENREKAFLIAQSTASALALPVVYTIRCGRGRSKEA